MSDIFISYAKKELQRVEPLAKALEEQGWSVWWDRKIPPGKTFSQVIEEAIDAAKCVIVLWSNESVKSDWVQNEAAEGARRRILVPALIDDVKIPFEFRRIQAADLTDWKAETDHPGFTILLSAISEIVGPSPLKVREAEEKRAEEERRRKQEEERKRREDEQRKAEEERKQKEAEGKRKAEEEKSRKEQEELKRKAEEEERERKDAEAKRKAEEEQNRRAVKEEIKTDKPESVKVKPSEPRKKRNALIFAAVAGVIVLLITGGWFYYKNQHEQQKKETLIKLERFYEQIEELERSVEKVDNQEQLKGLYRQRDKLNNQVSAFSEQATKVGLISQLEQLQDRLKKFDTQLGNKEKELIATRKGKMIVASAPDNATVKILNIDEPFQQGMELEPGKYHVQVSSEGYESQDKWTEIGPGEEKRISFELKKIEPKLGQLFIQTGPDNATVKILNIRPKFFQGMELEAGSYHVEVAAEGYETERRWVDIGAGHEEPFRFELAKIKVVEPTLPKKDITNSIGMKFVLISAGSFTMGSKLSPEEVVKQYGGDAKWFKDEHPRRNVEISKPFYLQTTEVTVGQWRKFVKETGYKTEAETGGGAYTWDGSKWEKKEGTYWDNPGFSQDDRSPVTCVSWNDALELIRWLNRKEGVNKYRLPTEAEWEYAVRAGTTTEFFFGDDAGKLGEYGWYDKNSDQKTHPVGQKKPNAWGLYDIYGNIWEWVEDDWHDTYKGAPPDGRAWVDNPRGARRVMRGGSWILVARFCRSAYRSYYGPDYRYGYVGFRLSRSVALGP